MNIFQVIFKRAVPSCLLFFGKFYYQKVLAIICKILTTSSKLHMARLIKTIFLQAASLRFIVGEGNWYYKGPLLI